MSHVGRRIAAAGLRRVFGTVSRHAQARVVLGASHGSHGSGLEAEAGKSVTDFRSPWNGSMFGQAVRAMTDAPSSALFIQVQQTPNPSSLMFIPGRSILSVSFPPPGLPR
mmetsp:Transcript_4107/g.10530  ORF Transcript_4107/g.10530 Transcript_4107/m.10530 type:complete len:110 (+) Transcript_4107:185-514(+)